jgi:hypothetical protein
MGRAVLACLGIVGVLACAPTGFAAATSSPASKTALEGFGCHRSANSLNRWIEITAVMRPVTGTARMSMKFQLLRKRAPSKLFADVSGGDLGKWIYPTDPPTLGSRPGDRWTVQKPVANLYAPAVYRFRVSFRWLGSSGQVLAETSRVSRLCSQS